MKTRIEREKEYHNKRFTKEVRQATQKYYKITKEIHEKIFENCNNSKVLELGCSKGGFSINIAKKGGEVIRIDISEVAVVSASENAKKAEKYIKS